MQGIIYTLIEQSTNQPQCGHLTIKHSSEPNVKPNTPNVNQTHQT